MTGDFMETQVNNTKPLVIKPTPQPIQAQVPTIPTPETPQIEHHKLMEVMYFLYDAFHRAQMDFFLVKQTARYAMKEHMLDNNRLDIGVRRLEWESGNAELLWPFFEQEHVTVVKREHDHIDFSHKDVPFTLHIYADNPCLKALVPIVYEYEGWLIPNRFDIFEEKYDK